MQEGCLRHATYRVHITQVATSRPLDNVGVKKPLCRD